MKKLKNKGFDFFHSLKIGQTFRERQYKEQRMIK